MRVLRKTLTVLGWDQTCVETRPWAGDRHCTKDLRAPRTSAPPLLFRVESAASMGGRIPCSSRSILVTLQ